MGLNNFGMTNRDVVVQHLEEQLKEIQQALKVAQGKNKVLKDCLSKIAEKICDDEYGYNQLGGKNQMLGLSDYELRDFIIRNFYNQRERLTENLINLQKLYYQESTDKDKIAAELLETQEQLEDITVRYNNLEYEYEMLKKTTPVTPSFSPNGNMMGPSDSSVDMYENSGYEDSSYNEYEDFPDDEYDVNTMQKKNSMTNSTETKNSYNQQPSTMKDHSSQISSSQKQQKQKNQTTPVQQNVSSKHNTNYGQNNRNNNREKQQKNAHKEKDERDNSRGNQREPRRENVRENHQENLRKNEAVISGNPQKQSTVSSPQETNKVKSKKNERRELQGESKSNRPYSVARPQNAQLQNADMNRNDKNITNDTRRNNNIHNHNHNHPATGTQQNNNIVYQDGKPIDLNKLLARVDLYQREVLVIMGKTGLNETVELEAACLDTGKFSSSSKFSSSLKQLKELKLVDEIQNPIASRPKLTLNKLSGTGAAIYKRLTKHAPVKDEMSRIQAMHDNIVHGYTIKDVSTILSDDYGYKVSMNSSENTINVGNNFYIPDIVGESTIDGKTIKSYWEVELGNHHDNDFIDKLAKAARVTNEVYIIVDNAETKKHIRQQIEKAQKLIMEQKILGFNLEIVYGTVNELKKKKLFSILENRIKLHK